MNSNWFVANYSRTIIFIGIALIKLLRMEFFLFSATSAVFTACSAVKSFFDWWAPRFTQKSLAETKQQALFTSDLRILRRDDLPLAFPLQPGIRPNQASRSIGSIF